MHEFSDHLDCEIFSLVSEIGTRARANKPLGQYELVPLTYSIDALKNLDRQRYSFLQYLKRLQLDQIKIAQDIVRDIFENDSDKTIVHTIIAMANSLKLNIIAEGVETEDPTPSSVGSV